MFNKLKFKKNQKFFKALAILSLLLAGLIITLVIQQTGNFDLSSRAAIANSCKSRSKAQCSGCFDSKYECKWNTSTKECKLNYNKSKCGDSPADDPKYTCGKTCITGITNCSQVDRANSNGSCYKGVCCGAKLIGGNYCANSCVKIVTVKQKYLEEDDHGHVIKLGSGVSRLYCSNVKNACCTNSSKTIRYVHQFGTDGQHQIKIGCPY